MANESNQAIVVSLKEKDLIAFNLDLLLKRKVVFIPIAVGIISLIALINQLIHHEPIRDLPQILFILFLDIFIVSSLFIGSKRAMRNKFVQEEKRYSLTADHLHMESDSMTATIQWQDFTRIVISKRSVCLFTGTNSAHLIPVHSLNENQLAFIRQQSFINEQKQPNKKGSKFLKLTFIYLILFLVVVALLQLFTR
ncbi:YcxB-like protein [Paenibacillus cellulosilyticus]|uniref:YcxB-like protein n=1 Tax=Paenibacillus cellulosilyticus TaxID=375489 RepID=A0A2V2YVQ2_9BACL|nr:YcxB family protein [Paenibacillus cellulosilyticus]PWW05451.1 YcxB-like protein [Paenibacillus cellulosilyticus]QKS45508.1 YcxB family protein [Paenibacillus cellulosilyticus]